MGDLFAASNPQSALGFPDGLCDAYKPKTLDSPEWCGLEKQRRILCNLAKNPSPRFLLFTGAPGTGKTSLAYSFSAAIKAEIHHIGSQEANLDNVKRICSMCNYVPLSGGFQNIIMDEADKMSPAVQLYMLSRMDGTEPLPSTFITYTCNSTDGLEPRFTSRCLILDPFNMYGESKTIKTLLARIWQERAGKTPLPDMRSVPTSNVREALMWLDGQLLSA